MQEFKILPAEDCPINTYYQWFAENALAKNQDNGYDNEQLFKDYKRNCGGSISLGGCHFNFPLAESLSQAAVVDMQAEAVFDRLIALTLPHQQARLYQRWYAQGVNKSWWWILCNNYFSTDDCVSPIDMMTVDIGVKSGHVSSELPAQGQTTSWFLTVKAPLAQRELVLPGVVNTDAVLTNRGWAIRNMTCSNTLLQHISQQGKRCVHKITPAQLQQAWIDELAQCRQRTQQLKQKLKKPTLLQKNLLADMPDCNEAILANLSFINPLFENNLQNKLDPAANTIYYQLQGLTNLTHLLLDYIESPTDQHCRNFINGLIQADKHRSKYTIEFKNLFILNILPSLMNEIQRNPNNLIPASLNTIIENQMQQLAILTIDEIQQLIALVQLCNKVVYCYENIENTNALIELMIQAYGAIYPLTDQALANDILQMLNPIFANIFNEQHPRSNSKLSDSISQFTKIKCRDLMYSLLDPSLSPLQRRDHFAHLMQCLILYPDELKEYVNDVKTIVSEDQQLTDIDKQFLCDILDYTFLIPPANVNNNRSWIQAAKNAQKGISEISVRRGQRETLLDAIDVWVIMQTPTLILQSGLTISEREQRIKALPAGACAPFTRQCLIREINTSHAGVMQFMPILMLDTMPSLARSLEITLNSLSTPGSPSTEKVIATALTNHCLDLTVVDSQTDADKLIKAVASCRVVAACLAVDSPLKLALEKWLTLVAQHSQTMLLEHAYYRFPVIKAPKDESVPKFSVDDVLDRVFPQTALAAIPAKQKQTITKQIQLLVRYHKHPKRTQFLSGESVKQLVRPETFASNMRVLLTTLDPEVLRQTDPGKPAKLA